MAIGPGASGSRALGRYELIQELAKSQIGPLWVAHVPGGELCTIRRVSTAPPVTGEEKDALSEGAWWTLEVQHPTIMHGKDVVMSEGELGIVTEYVEGEVLRSVLRLSSFKRKPIPVNAALRIGLDVLEALHEAGAQAQPLSDGKSSYAQGGLVPDSVMIGSDGKTRLLDVGVAGACAGVSTIARNPEMVAYSAPEHIDAKPLDIRANVYAVGVMLWEMLAGKRLYVGSTHAAVVERIKAGDPPRLDASKPVGGEPIPAAVADVIARAIESDPEKRYESPQAMSEALAGATAAASHADVAALIDDLAGNTLATRRKVIDRATKPGAAPARAAMPTAPALKPQPKPAPAAESPKPPAAEASPIPPPADARREAPPPPARARKQTLLGIAPPPPRAQVEWIESEDLESISKIQAVPVEPTEGALVAALTSDESPKPKPAEAADAGAPATHLKTQMLGTPAAALLDTADEKEKPKDAIPAPFTFGALGDSAPASEPDEAVPISLEPESIQESELVPESLPEPQAPRVPIAAASEGDAADDPGKSLARDSDSEARSSDDDSAVAWLGPPPGVALDEPEGERVDKERKKKMMKIVGGVTAGAAAMLLLALAFGTGKPEETPTEPQPPAANTAPAETAKPEPPKPPEPEATAKEPEPPKEEPKEEPKPEPEPEPEPKAEEPAPKPVAKSTTTWRPKTTTTTRTTSTKTSSKPKPKPKPSFTPSGI
jgi:serine/threonine-protein kinase